MPPSRLRLNDEDQEDTAADVPGLPGKPPEKRMVRIVRSPEGEFSVDFTGKKLGAAPTSATSANASTRPRRVMASSVRSSRQSTLPSTISSSASCSRTRLRLSHGAYPRRAHHEPPEHGSAGAPHRVGRLCREQALKGREAVLVFVAADASDETKKDYTILADRYKVPYLEGLDRETLGQCSARSTALSRP